MPDEPAVPRQPPPGEARAAAVVALHALALRRQFGVIRAVFGDHPPHRAREALWVALEVVLAHQEGRPVALRDIAARAEGLISAPTLSRAVAELERADLLSSSPAPEDSRVKLLHPTPRALGIVTARAEEAFAEFAGLVREAERRSSAAAAGA